MAGFNDTLSLARQAILRPSGGTGVQVGTVFVIMAAVPLTTILVYQTGGTQFAWPYLMILPIAMAGMVFKLWGGVLIGVVGGVALGPYMPIDTLSGTMQETGNWLLRLGFYMLIGGTIGAMATLLDYEVRKRTWQTVRDASTGLLNVSSLPMLAVDAYAGRTDFFTLVIRLANYKEIHHAFGDPISNEFAAAVFRRISREVAPASATPMRLDVDALAVLVGGDRSAARNTILGILRTVPQSVRVRELPLPVVAHGGFAKIRRQEATGPAPFQKAALGCDRAQRLGRRFARYDATEQEGRKENVLLMNELVKDLNAGCFQLHYQPQLSLKDGSIHGAEALIRWNSPKLGFIPPDRFIPIVENSGLISEVTAWVVGEAVNEMAAWQRADMSIGMSINISAVNLTDHRIRDQLLAVDGRNGSGATGFELELTETAVLSQQGSAFSILDELRGAGYRIAIDDFGTGYSSLALFKDLDVDVVKIDRAFIGAMLQKREAAQIVSATIGMCRERGITVVAEGAEDGETIDALRTMGCDLVQGYGIARPMPASAFIDWMASRPDPGTPVPA